MKLLRSVQLDKSIAQTWGWRIQQKRYHTWKKIRKDTIISSCGISSIWTENSNAMRR